MKDKSREFVQRIQKHYVADDCIQIMIPYCTDGITILNSDEITFHYYPNSEFFVDKYESDIRKEDLPYSNISSYIGKKKGKKLQYINQLIDFNKPYFVISDGFIREFYAQKIDDEALMATKSFIPDIRKTQYITRDEFKKTILEKSNGGIYRLDGARVLEFNLKSDDEIVKEFKNDMMRVSQYPYERLRSYINAEYNGLSLKDCFLRGIEIIDISDIPEEYCKCEYVFVSKTGDEISSIKQIRISFAWKDTLKLEIYDVPITIYSLEHLKQLEQTSSRKTKEPQISSYLNPSIDSNYIKEEKAKVKKLTRKVIKF
jgi:hypothetical protein